MIGKNIEIYDTTLRDGSQAEGISFSVNDKLKIIALLDELGVDYIEAGWPGANPKDVEVFGAVKSMNLKNSKITAFGCTRKPNTLPQEDSILVELLNADTEIITVFGKTWDYHVEHALNTSNEENLKMIFDSVSYLKSKGKRVFFDAEHFYDGFKNNSEYALSAVKSAFEAGAERIILCDTNGGCLPDEITEITLAVKQALPDADLGIHSHNDADLAVANSLACIKAGGIQVQGTINGYGERCGNANLCSIIPNILFKTQADVANADIEKLVYVSRQINEIANKKVNDHAPYVGKSAFAHKAGIHASGVRKQSKTYEHISPEMVGNTRRILISDQSGLASIREKIKHLKLNNVVEESALPKVVEHIKKLEWQGFAFEDADASFELMLMNVIGSKPKFFELLGFRMIGDTTTAMSELNTEASVKIKVGEEVVHTVSEGDGPVHALDMALRKALRPMYPQIDNYKLSDFKVRILDSTDGTDAKVRVHVETTNGNISWDTVGVSRNVIEAAYIAITDSIEYGLMVQSIAPYSNNTAIGLEV